MFENYHATPKDLETIKEALTYVEKPELNFIFKDKNKIKKTLIVSYDAKNIYVWADEKGKYKLHQISHKLKVQDKDQWGWRVGLRPFEITKYLPKKWQSDLFSLPKISGGLLKPFVELQKTRNSNNNPYISKESYLATIIHEFGHVYFNQQNQHWNSNKKQNLNCLAKALKLYLSENSLLNPIMNKINIPCYYGLSELFAFCTDYTAATIFWPQHKKDIDKSNISRLNDLLATEKKRNLNRQDSTLDENPHDFALVIGKLLLTKYPGNWPEKLINGASFAL